MLSKPIFFFYSIKHLKLSCFRFISIDFIFNSYLHFTLPMVLRWQNLWINTCILDINVYGLHITWYKTSAIANIFFQSLSQILKSIYSLATIHLDGIRIIQLTSHNLSIITYTMIFILPLRYDHDKRESKCLLVNVWYPSGICCCKWQDHNIIYMQILQSNYCKWLQSYSSSPSSESMLSQYRSKQTLVIFGYCKSVSTYSQPSFCINKQYFSGNHLGLYVPGVNVLSVIMHRQKPK